MDEKIKKYGLWCLDCTAKWSYKIILSERQRRPKWQRAKRRGGAVYRFLNANKNRSEHLVKTSLSSEAPTDIKDGRSPPLPLPLLRAYTAAATIGFNVQKSQARSCLCYHKPNQGLGEEMKPVPQWKGYVLLARTKLGTRGESQVTLWWKCILGP